MIGRLLALQERGRSLINSGRAAGSAIMADEVLKGEIRALYRHYFGKALGGCKNCYADAMVELCTIKKERAMSNTDLFVVRRGKVLKDTVANDARKNLVRGNETEDLALYHLHTNPGSRQFFERLPDPDRLEAMLAEYSEKYEAKHGGSRGVTAAADKVLNEAKAEAGRIVEAAKAEAKKILLGAKTAPVRRSKTPKKLAEAEALKNEHSTAQ